MMMVDHLADVWNRCTDVCFGQIHGADEQVMLTKQITADESVQGQGLWIISISSQLRVKSKVKACSVSGLNA